MSDTLPTRTEDGKFPTGVSGNPAGRPKGKKNEITELRQDMELAVRKHLSFERVAKIVDRMATLAESGNVAAAKLLLDKVVANARDAEEDGNVNPSIVIRIENATIAAQNKSRSTSPEPIEGEIIEEIQK